MKIEHAWVFVSFGFIPTFLDHELGKKFVSYVWVDIFSLCIRMATIRTELIFLPFKFKYENTMYVHGQP
jgi:hypothetical protein